MTRGSSTLPARVNDDYELELFKDEMGPRPHRMGHHLLDYMFFCMNKNPDASLFTRKIYSTEFLSYLEELGFIVPEIVSSGDYYNWYGTLENIPKEKRLNSKLYSYDLLNKLKLNPCPNFVVSSREEMADVMQNHQYQTWFLKCPYDMAGIGIRKIKKDTDLPEIDREFILEPELDRVFDVSFYFNIRNRTVSFYRNLVLPSGKYYGGVLYENQDDFESWMSDSGLSPVYEKWRKVSEIILAEIMQEGPEQSFSVDAFIYKTDTSFDLHPMTEINYRETVGGCLLSLRQFLPQRGTGILLTVPAIDASPFNTFMPYSTETKKGIIFLSPQGSDQATIFCSAANLVDAENMVRKFLFITGISSSF